jgi:hypothetical protein
VLASSAAHVGIAQQAPPAGDLQVIALPRGPRCATGAPRAFIPSCAYLDRRDAVDAADADTAPGSLSGIYDFST